MFEKFDEKRISFITNKLALAFEKLEELKKTNRDKKTLASLEILNNKKQKIDVCLNHVENYENVIDLPEDLKTELKNILFDFLFSIMKEKNKKIKITDSLIALQNELNSLCL